MCAEVDMESASAGRIRRTLVILQHKDIRHKKLVLRLERDTRKMEEIYPKMILTLPTVSTAWLLSNAQRQCSFIYT